jgi:hypothetical protein
MRHLLFLVAIFVTVNLPAQSLIKDEFKDPTIKKRIICYDPHKLRISGKSLPIGILTILTNGDTLKTRKFLKGKDKWTKYRLEVEGGNYVDGKIKIKGTNSYKKSDSITVNLFTRKWLLGKKDQWLLTQKIPYNYETGIHFFTSGNFKKAPGNHIQFGIRTYFDNKMFVDKWASPSGGNLRDFILTPDGGHISRSRGDLKIFNDPDKITRDKVKLIATLAKYPAITDTLQIMLNYIDHYECKIQSNGQGHNLKVTANVYFDSIINEKLLKVKIIDTNNNLKYNCIVNVNGGSLTIESNGAGGSDGSHGLDGNSGSSGSDGTTNTTTTTESDGSTTTTTVTGPGGNGSNGSDGQNGSNGGDGFDGGNISISYSPSAKPYLNRIKVISKGGNGGRGVSGGSGGRGGSGGSGSPPGSSGNSGNDGSSGSNGSDGNNGKIVFIPIQSQ